MLKKIVIGILVVLVLLIGALVAIPFIFKDKLIAIAKTEINDQINAKVDWKDFGVTVFKDFPNVSLCLQGVTVVNVEPFKGDTLANIGEIAISADIMSVIKGGQIGINSIGIDKPVLHVKVLKDGTANYNIMKPDSAKKTTSGESTQYSIKLKKFTITGGHIVYDDKAGDLYAQIDNLNHTLKGDFTQSVLDITSTTNADSITVISGGVPYLNRVKTALKLDANIDQDHNKYTLRDNDLQLNALDLGLNGSITMGKANDMDLDLTFKAKETDFKNIISLIPAIYSQQFKDVKTSGTLALDGYAKGKYAGEVYPAFGVTLKVGNGSFQYPGLPAAVTNINIDASAKSPGGDLDKTVVDVNKFGLTLGSDPFNMKLHVSTPISDPDLDASLVGKVNLGNVKNYYPLEGAQLSGLLNLNVTAKGRLSTLEKQQYQNFDAAGTVEISNMDYTSKDLPKAVKVNNLKLSFSPKFVALDNLSAQIGKSDFNATGRLDNLLNYVFSNAMLKGTFSLKSRVIDLNEFMTADSKTTTTQQTTDKGKEAQVATTAAQVPANLDFAMDASVGKLYYTNMELDNVDGKLTVKDETVTLNSLKANTLNGSIALDGSYSTYKTEVPKVDMKINLNKIDINKAATTFNSSEKLMPVAKSLHGTFSTNFTVKGTLDKTMSPDLNTLLADGRVDLNDVSISGNQTLNTIADKLKLSQLKNLNVKDAWTVVKIVNGKLYVEPFDVTVGKVKMNIFGSNSLAGTMDYSILMDMPSELMSGATSVVSGLLAKNPIPGISASSLPQNLKFKIGLTGQTTSPSVSVGLVSAGGTSVKDQAKQQLDDAKKKLEDEAAKAKADAEAKAKAEIEKQKQAAQKKAQEAADKAKKQAEDKAKDELNKLKGKLKFP